MTILSILYAIAVFGLIILVHEFGHFIAAKLSGIAVYRFSIGFGPALIKWTRQGTDYALRLFPIGGAVVMRGEAETADNDDEPEQYRNVPGKGYNEATWTQRFFVSISGSLMNILCGLVILIIIMMPVTAVASGTITGFMEGFQYEGTGGFEKGDKIVAINDIHIYIYGDVVTGLALGEGKPFDFTVLRDGQRVKLTGLPLTKSCYSNDAPDTPRYGFLFTTQELSFGGKLAYAANNSISFLQAALKSIKLLVAGQVKSNELMGTIGIASELTERASQGPDFWYFVAFLTINIAFVNLLPIPALDGGRVIFLLVELVTRRRLNPKFEKYITLIGFGLLMLLFVFVTFNDIVRLVKR